jgi:hypothetical protein
MGQRIGIQPLGVEIFQHPIGHYIGTKPPPPVNVPTHRSTNHRKHAREARRKCSNAILTHISLTSYLAVLLFSADGVRLSVFFGAWYSSTSALGYVAGALQSIGGCNSKPWGIPRKTDPSPHAVARNPSLAKKLAKRQTKTEKDSR